MNGTFASPGYPASLTTSLQCHWRINVPARRRVNVRLTVSPSLSAGTGSGGTSSSSSSGPAVDRACRSSYVAVYAVVGLPTRSTLLGRYCVAVSIISA